MKSNARTTLALAAAAAMSACAHVCTGVKQAGSSLGYHAYALTFGHMARNGLILFADDPEMVVKELKRIGDQVKEVGEKALAEAKKAGDLSAETKSNVDQLLVKQGELQARLQAVEQKADQGGREGGAADESMGAKFVGSDGYKSWVEGGGMKTSREAFSMRVKAITSNPASAGDGIAPDRRPGVQELAMRRMTIRDLITPGTTTSAVVQYLQETGFTNNAGVRAEGAASAESVVVYDQKNANVANVTHHFKATKQILDDFAQLQSQIDGRLYYGLKLAEEAQLLSGSGAGNNMLGLRIAASAYFAPIVVASATRIDVLRLALLQAELAEYPSTGIVLHPSDWAAIELLKDSTGAYIFANPQSLAAPGLWGRPVVATPAQPLDEFLVGAFQLGAQVYDREEANIVIATQNEDDFTKGMVTVRAEERLALAIYRPEAFVKGDITPAP